MMKYYYRKFFMMTREMLPMVRFSEKENAPSMAIMEKKFIEEDIRRRKSLTARKKHFLFYTINP